MVIYCSDDQERPGDDEDFSRYIPAQLNVKEQSYYEKSIALQGNRMLDDNTLLGDGLAWSDIRKKAMREDVRE